MTPPPRRTSNGPPGASAPPGTDGRPSPRPTVAIAPHAAAPRQATDGRSGRRGVTWAAAGTTIPTITPPPGHAAAPTGSEEAAS